MSHDNETPSIQLPELQQQLEDMKRKFEESQARIQTLQEQLPVESPGSASETSSQEASANPAKQQEIIFVSRERKIKHFTGLSDSPTSRVEDFIEDVRGVAASREMNPQQQVDFIMSNLDGPAKEEIRLLDSDVRKNPELVFTALQEEFGERRSLTQLLRLFYERHQRENESLRGYSHALSDIIGHICRKNGDAIPSKDQALRDQFSENVRDPVLPKELKKLIRQDPAISFLQLREEAFQWAEDELKPTPRKTTSLQEATVRETAEQMTQILKALKEQQESLQNLTAALTKQQGTINRTPQVGLRQRGKNGAPGGSSRTCFVCARPGHFATECPNKNASGAGTPRSPISPN